ncbi:hypothetical protein Tsubulata_004048 [Turnera subulata]|uniref:DUF3598 domain-containing protein n=1 Tax=Turnera subulata TaxID=218843 RepID=A0A9Q0F9L5_9ROSI|nr:hypothetical protein Tsubulata_004048 [Turnera subulata]
MATHSASSSLYPLPSLSKSYTIPLSSSSRLSNPVSARRSSRIRCTTATTNGHVPGSSDPESMSVDTLHRFFEVNKGRWNGIFHQFDEKGKLLQNVSTRLAVSTYGEDDLMSLIQTLYIKQPPIEPGEELEWAEYKIKETNIFTVDKYQQICFFPEERAFALRYQLAGMLENVLRQGVLGEDDTGEESPRNLKLPSRRPALVCENCLYSQETDRRARAFHIMDPKGILEMLLIFVEDRGAGVSFPPVLDGSTDAATRISPFLGRWKGHSITKRSGIYGATLAEADTIAVLEMDDQGRVIQDITNTSDSPDVTTNVHWTGTMSGDLVMFDGGYQMVLLPGGMYMGCPCDLSKSVADATSFHLEFCWVEAPGKRQRLVRTFDMEGYAVSSTYFSETKL